MPAEDVLRTFDHRAGCPFDNHLLREKSAPDWARARRAVARAGRVPGLTRLPRPAVRRAAARVPSCVGA
eukprot:gene5165-3035_t